MTRLSPVHPAPFRANCPSCGGTIRQGNDQHTLVVGDVGLAIHANPVCVKQAMTAYGAEAPPRGLRVQVNLELSPEQVDRLGFALGVDPDDPDDRLPGGAVAMWARELVSAALATLPDRSASRPTNRPRKEGTR